MLPNDSTTASDRPIGQLAGLNELESVVGAFPSVVHSFGYGSGVFQQMDISQAKSQTVADYSNDVSSTGTTSHPGMIDIILATENNAMAFHRENMARHASHYSAITRLGGPSLCRHLQQDYGAGVFFHALIPMQAAIIKYGVVTVDDLAKDLKEWNYLYLAGRLHKPTVAIRSSNPDIILDYQQTYNLPYALSTALLLLSESKSETLLLKDLYEKITLLSYAGDPRMHVGGEDPDKVHKIVHSPGQLERFQQLYNLPLKQLESAGIVSVNHDKLYWNPRDACLGLRERIPPRFRHTTNLLQDLQRVVAKSATSQSLKGLIAVGLVKSARYAMAKLSKGILKQML